MTTSHATMSSKESAGLVDKTKALLYTENWDDAELRLDDWTPPSPRTWQRWALVRCRGR